MIRRFCRSSCVALLLLGCRTPETSAHVPLAERAAAHTLEQIPAQPVAGQIRGQAFRSADARVRVVTMPGRQRIDLLLAEAPIEHCGVPLPRSGRRVWLRLPGNPELDGSPLRAEPGAPAPFSVHYEALAGTRWLGHEGGAALVGLRRLEFGKYEGALWTCFDDAQHSCVSGRFTASECRAELDVDDDVWGAARVVAREAHPARNEAVDKPVR